MKIWYDISGIYNWSGNFTGIQRVVYNLAQELDNSKLNHGFFIYHSGRFSEISFKDLEERLEALNSKTPSRRSTDKRITLSKLQHHGISTLKNTVRDTRLEPQLRSIYGNLRKGYRSVRGRQITPASNLFNKDDTIVVVDGNWQFRGYEKTLTSLKAKTGFRLVHFVNDLIAIKNPALVNKGADKIIGKYFNHIFENADMLIAISESTKKDIVWFIERYNIQNRPDIEVVILGDNISSSEVKIKKPDISIPSPFILSVGTIEIRKNYTALYYAYKQAHLKRVSLPHLVIVGRKGWMAEEAYSLLTQDTDISQYITILQSADDQKLEWLYSNCIFTVFPSFYEGWGLPVAESFAHGKCCISSNSSSMPEVGGSLAVYVSPYNTDELLSSIARLYSNQDERSKMENNIKINHKSRSWGQALSQLTDIITKS
jgi:glycosyltransferase involved in cell wall biosynthesis